MYLKVGNSMAKDYNREYLSMVIRNNIRKYRKKNDLTQQDLADLTGLSHGYIRDLECPNRKKTPKVETLGKIAVALNIDITKLFQETKDK